MKPSVFERRWYLKGYIDATSDFGIWGFGMQHIGCLETPIKEVQKRKWRELFPKCVCPSPLGECPGCMADEEIECKK